MNIYLYLYKYIYLYISIYVYIENIHDFSIISISIYLTYVDLPASSNIMSSSGFRCKSIGGLFISLSKHFNTCLEQELFSSIKRNLIISPFSRDDLVIHFLTNRYLSFFLSSCRTGCRLIGHLDGADSIHDNDSDDDAGDSDINVSCAIKYKTSEVQSCSMEMNYTSIFDHTKCL